MAVQGKLNGTDQDLKVVSIGMPIEPYSLIMKWTLKFMLTRDAA